MTSHIKKILFLAAVLVFNNTALANLQKNQVYEFMHIYIPMYQRN
jgi:hypothetical protein